jgi:glycosyltransferase involved in cell wall biosynthesis
MKLKVIVAQKGTREYFLAPRALHRRGSLAQMIVDWYTPFNGTLSDILKKSSLSTISRAFTAHSAELPKSLVRSMPIFGIYARFYSKYLRKIHFTSNHLNPGVMFAERLAKLNMPPHNTFFGYSYSSLEVLIAEKRRGKHTILDQIDPGILEREIIIREEKKWPKYVLKRIADFTNIHQRNKKEWNNADVVIVNSNWSKECIVKKGCDPDKIEILPLAYEKQSGCTNEAIVPPPLKVLWIGRVTLQKGIPYLIEAARLLAGEPIEFYIAGTTDISKNAINDSPSNIKWLGSVSVNKKMGLYSSSHVFVLPTLSDGFAITQLEAFAHGLPVITTRHCGRVVEEGKTGYIVPARDAEALAMAILQFLKTPSLLKEMGDHCRKEVQAYNIDAYADGLIHIINDRLDLSY